MPDLVICKKAQSAYLAIAEGEVDLTVGDSGVNIDYDKHGQILGIELLHVKDINVTYV